MDYGKFFLLFIACHYYIVYLNPEMYWIMYIENVYACTWKY